MLQKLFATAKAGHAQYGIDAERQSYDLLHGQSNFDNYGSTKSDDIRILIAQDLGDKTKAVLFDTDKSGLVPAVSPSVSSSLGSAHSHGQTLLAYNTSPQRHSSNVGPGQKRSKGLAIELITELMFGAIPLSYKGTSTRVHSLASPDSEDRRPFLLTKLFAVDPMHSPGVSSPPLSSGTNSLASSWGSSSSGGFNTREFPFPTMTPMTKPSDQSPDERRCSAGGHERYASSGNPHMPFSNDLHELQPHHWLPSPGPRLCRRRRSVDPYTAQIPGAGSSRYKSTMYAIGVIFYMSGDGADGIECSALSRYWHMIMRSVHALQRVVYEELEQALTNAIADGAIWIGKASTKTSRPSRQMHSQAQIRGKRLALTNYCLMSNDAVRIAIDEFRERLVGGVNLPLIVRNKNFEKSKVFMDELCKVLELTDQKTSKFFFSTLITAMAQLFYVSNSRLRDTSKTPEGISPIRKLVIISNDPTLARKLLFCITNIFFKDLLVAERTSQNDDFPDYSLVWPAAGFLATPRKELLKRKQTNLSKIGRTTISRSSPQLPDGWDIPGYQKNNTSQYILPLASPSSLRPSSRDSFGSQKIGSWKPSSWFGSFFKGSGTDDSSVDTNDRGDLKQLQRSWNSTEFAEVAAKSPPKSPHSDFDHGDLTSDDEDDTDYHWSAPGTRDLTATLNPDGTVEVGLLSTMSVFDNLPSATIGPWTTDSYKRPVAGYLARYHPDMFVQAVPHSEIVDTQIKCSMEEEDIYHEGEEGMAQGESIEKGSILVADVDDSWRIRLLTRKVKRKQVNLRRSEKGVTIKADEVREFALPNPIVDEYTEDILTDVDDRLVNAIYQAVTQYSNAKESDLCVQDIQSAIQALCP